MCVIEELKGIYYGEDTMGNISECLMAAGWKPVMREGNYWQLPGKLIRVVESVGLFSYTLEQFFNLGPLVDEIAKIRDRQQMARV